MISAGISGSADGIGTNATFNSPMGIAVDSNGTVYVIDLASCLLRKTTPSGTVTTLAGGFQWPPGVAVDSSGTVYVTEHNWNQLLKITPSGTRTTLAGGIGSGLIGVAVDSNGTAYVADRNNNRIQKITPSGDVTTLAGGLYGPHGVAVDSSGTVYVADSYNHAIQKITPSGTVTTFAGIGWCCPGSTNGVGTNARFNGPVGIAVDSSGNVYVADTGNHMIRKNTA